MSEKRSIDAAQPDDGRRNPIIAFLLNLVLPPLGYVYAHSLRAGLTYLGVILAAFAVILSVTWFAPPGFYVFGHDKMAALGILAVRVLVAVALGTHAALLARRPGERAKNGMMGWALAVLIWAVPLALSFGVRTLLVRPYSIPSASMNPTLREGDLVGVTASGLCGRDGVGVGDVVAYRRPSSDVLGPGGDTWIGRIVAGAGQTVRMKGGVPEIDGRLLTKIPKGRFVDPDVAFAPPSDRFRETLPNGRSHDTLDMGSGGHMDETAPTRVPSGHWFIMGDNRDNSIDSRVFGPVPADDVCGVAEKILYARDRVRIGSRP